MEVETIDGMTKDNIKTLIEYMEFMTDFLESINAMDAFSVRLLEKPELLIKIIQILNE